MEYSNIIDILLEVLIGAAVGFIIKLVGHKINMDKLGEVLRWVAIAVRAAEDQVKRPKAGIEKKAMVTDFILDKFNNKIDDDDLSVAIDSAVYDMNLEKKKKELENSEPAVLILENSTTNQSIKNKL